jgi:apolipoprotein N-acyltransferase
MPNNLLRRCAAPLAGFALTLSFAPYQQAYLAPLALAAFYVLCRRRTWQQAAFTGFGFGFAMFGFGVWYAYISIHDNGGGDVVSSILLTVVLAGFMALFLSLSGAALAWASKRTSPVLRALWGALLWVLIEWLRGYWVLNGFPWLQIGYSQLGLPLSGFTPILGVYGVGFLLAACTFMLVELWLARPQRWIALAPAFAVAVLWAGGFYLNQYHSWTEPQGAPIRVTLLQGNIGQTEKWREDQRFATLQRYFEMSEQHWQDSDVIIWPETAIPAFYHQIDEHFLQPLGRRAAEYGVEIVAGVPYIESGKDYYNSVVVLGASGAQRLYHKHHLLPFGEYLPLQPLSGWVLDKLQIPLGDFAAGAIDQPLLQAGGQSFVTTICYEDVFGQQVAAQAAQAGYLVNVTNDAWFGDSSQPYQHMQMAQMRALETGRYLARATNTGLTGFVDARGRLFAQLPLFTQDSLTATIQPMQGLTPYMRLGDYGCFLLLAALTLSATLLSRFERTERT